MIIYLLIKAFDSVLFALISLIPVLETPSWLVTSLPDVLTRIASFNYYLPITESVTVILFLIGFTLTYKLAKIILNVFHVDLNS